MSNEAHFSVAGFVATKPSFSATKTGVSTMSMRLAWTPRRIERATGEWVDEPTCFVSVKCFGRTAENSKFSLDKGDPVVVTGTLRMHDYEAKDGSQRTSVDITATSIGHDLSRGVTAFRRLRPKDERSSQDGQADATEAAGVPESPDDAPRRDQAGSIEPAEDGMEAMTDVDEVIEHAGDPVGAPF